MAGTIGVDAVQTGSVGLPPVFKDSAGTEMGQLCRAWVNFNGVTTASVRASFNVSSVTRNATGNYTVNFTTAMPDANYGVSSTASGGISGGAAGICVLAEALATSSSYSTKTTSAVRILCTDNNNDTLVDAFSANVCIFR